MLARDPETDFTGTYCHPAYDLPDLLPGLVDDLRGLLATRLGIAKGLVDEPTAQATYAAVVELITTYNTHQRACEPYPDPVIEEVFLTVSDTPSPPLHRSLQHAMRSMWIILTPEQRMRWMNLVATEDEPALYSGGRDVARRVLLPQLENYERFVAEPSDAMATPKLTQYAQTMTEHRRLCKTASIQRLMRIALDCATSNGLVHPDAQAQLATAGWTTTATPSEGDVVYRLSKGEIIFTAPRNAYTKEEIEWFLRTRGNAARPYGKPE